MSTTDSEAKIEPATQTAHWPGKSVNVCDRHARALDGIAGAMGFPLTSTPFNGQEPCINCVNEAKKRDR